MSNRKRYFLALVIILFVLFTTYYSSDKIKGMNLASQVAYGGELHARICWKTWKT
jgi:hypothetical protein